MQNAADVIVSRKYHQHHNDREPNAKPDLLRSFRQGAATEGLNGVEQKVAAVEQRDRKQVQKPDRSRQEGREMQQLDKCGAESAVVEPTGPGIAGNLGDFDGTAELIGRFAADEDTS